VDGTALDPDDQPGNRGRVHAMYGAALIPAHSRPERDPGAWTCRIPGELNPTN
jgi:hypothetical protein